MSYLYPTGIASGFSGLASLWATRFSSVTGGPALPTMPTGTDGFLQAMADGIMASVGFQAQSRSVALGTATSNSGSYVDIGNGSSTGFATFTYVATVAKQYYVHIGLTFYCANSATCVAFQLLNNGATTGVDNHEGSQAICMNVVDVKNFMTFIIPVNMSVGNNILKLQWKVTAGAGILAVDSGNFRTFMVTG